MSAVIEAISTGRSWNSRFIASAQSALTSAADRVRRNRDELLKAAEKSADENWIQLMDLITIEYGINVVEIGTHEPLNYSSKSFLNLVGKTSIEETCTLIKSARFFLGIDSGPTHIANAFKIPALILCGHFANFKKYMSYSGAYQEKGGIANIYFNASGSTRELPFLEVWEELQKTILTSKSLALKAV